LDRRQARAFTGTHPTAAPPKWTLRIDELVLNESARLGIIRRAISDAEIVDRSLLALVNEGAKAISEGIAYRPVDIDIVYVNGYGFPAERGGPMFQADARGVASVVEGIRRFGAGRHSWGLGTRTPHRRTCRSRRFVCFPERMRIHHRVTLARGAIRIADIVTRG